MPDYGSIVADKAIAATARKVHQVYTRAAKEVQGKLSDFTKRFAAKQKTMLARIESGEITKKTYQKWLKGQVFIGKQWEQKVDQSARIMSRANAEAAMIVQTGRLDVFAENYNYAAYELEKRVGGSVGFGVYSGKSVARLIKEKPQMLPVWKIDEAKDYIWNRQKVENCIMQGIIQGKPITEIASDMANSLCSTNENKMLTFARTAMTGAQNAGRQEQMEDAEELGIKVKKKWVATLDDRTRDTHQDLDGQEVDIDEPFTVDTENGEVEIMFPGDPSCDDPAMVYNCRCAMIQVYEGIDRHSVRRDMDDYAVEDMTYHEWKEAKENGTLPTDRRMVERPIGDE